LSLNWRQTKGRVIIVLSAGPNAKIEIVHDLVPQTDFNDVLIRPQVCNGDVSLTYIAWDAVGLKAEESKVGLYCIETSAYP
jgi:hypothetical protein